MNCRFAADFAYPNITPEAVRLMIEELKGQGMPVNGLLDKTEPVTFGDDGITIHVNAGRPILESVELPRVLLAELIQERTGSLPYRAPCRQRKGAHGRRI